MIKAYIICAILPIIITYVVVEVVCTIIERNRYSNSER